MDRLTYFKNLYEEIGEEYLDIMDIWQSDGTYINEFLRSNNFDNLKTIHKKLVNRIRELALKYKLDKEIKVYRQVNNIEHLINKKSVFINCFISTTIDKNLLDDDFGEYSICIILPIGTSLLQFNTAFFDKNSNSLDTDNDETLLLENELEFIEFKDDIYIFNII